MSSYDVIVIGSGPGGYVAAIRCAQLGLKVACVEGRETLGGTCLNVGCIPSKALLHSSHLYEEAAHGWGPHGISADNVKMDLGKLMEHKAKTVTGLTGGIEGLLKKYKVDYFKGKGEILKAGTVKVTPIEGGEAATLDTKNIVIATGSVPASPHISPISTISRLYLPYVSPISPLYLPYISPISPLSRCVGRRCQPRPSLAPSLAPASPQPRPTPPYPRPTLGLGLGPSRCPPRCRACPWTRRPSPPRRARSTSRRPPRRCSS